MIIGLTGGFGSGKTTVAKMFRAKKTLVVDADKIAHQIIRPKTSTYKKIIDHFGKIILTSDSQINRDKLGVLVFKNKKELKWLIEVIHPSVVLKIKVLIKKYKRLYPKKSVILDVPLLFEAGLDSLTDKLIVVKCKLSTQISRTKIKTGLNRQEILKRINSQLPMSKKVKMADWVIDNGGTLFQTRRQVEKVYNKFLLR